MGVPPPKVQRGLLVSAAVVGARSQMEVEELSDMLAHMYACQQAQPVLHAHVLLCRVASHSSALQVEETEPLVAGEQQKKEGSQNALLRCPSSWWLALAVSSMPADE